MNSEQLKLAIAEKYKSIMGTNQDPAVFIHPSIGISDTPYPNWQKWGQNPKKWKRQTKYTVDDAYTIFDGTQVPSGSVIRIFGIPDTEYEFTAQTINDPNGNLIAIYFSVH